MKTQLVTILSNEHDILFDDHSLLETAFGKGALMSSAPNTNCDCISHSSNADDEDFSPDQIAPVAG